MDELKTEMTHVMLDLETWGTGSNALPVSIGAVRFDLVTDVTETHSDAFHVGIVPASCKPFGFDIDPDTMMWWLDEQRSEARREWMALEKTDIATALTAFTMWLNNTNCKIWGNGAAFDNVILRNAIEKVLGPGTVPWKFRNDRCFRTVKAMTRGGFTLPDPIGTAHNALSDALWQARYLQVALRANDVDLD